MQSNARRYALESIRPEGAQTGVRKRLRAAQRVGATLAQVIGPQDLRPGWCEGATLVLQVAGVQYGMATLVTTFLKAFRQRQMPEDNYATAAVLRADLDHILPGCLKAVEDSPVRSMGGGVSEPHVLLGLVPAFTAAKLLWYSKNSRCSSRC
ncbi:g5682 [Coccomyxa viridis]|uniref:G5682 protein n=1 Tax=Coccomyxa viridis TaxID=1274662 RepID=A0ABP1FYJ4_9CHLO